jgi:DNA polymerase III subunit delta
MPSHTIDALSRSLKQGDLAAVYYFHGPEEVLKGEAVSALLDRVLDPGTRDFNLDQRSAAQLDPEQIHALCNTVPMMADRRVVVVREVETWKRKAKSKSEFLRYLEHPNPTTVVVLVQSSADPAEDRELSRDAYTVRFDPLSPDRAEKWVLRRAGQLGFALEPEAARHLVRAVEADLGTLDSELAKLASLPEGHPITVERVGELVGVRHGETLWDWRDAVLDHQPGRAIQLSSAVLAQPGVSGVKLVTQLGTALIGIGIGRTYHDRGMHGRALEDAIFRMLLRNKPAGLLGYRDEAAQWARWVPHWPAPLVRLALKATQETDIALKSTTVSDERGLVTDLVLRIGLIQSERPGRAEHSRQEAGT